MLLEYIGHAGFFINYEDIQLIMDPWVSSDGAYDRAWFQFPCNHQYLDLLLRRIRTNKNNYIYISHEHKDHFDKEFLSAVAHYQPTVIIPKFFNARFRNETRNMGFEKIIELEDEQGYQIRGESFTVKLYVDDSQLDRDSAILVRSNDYKFLNLNDCKIFDRLSKIKKDDGEIDIFAVQFSGATWHPVCYKYDFNRYNEISVKKKLSKFRSVLNSLKILQPRRYFPSAGPACFLDPELFHINFQENNTFPFQYEVIDYLNRRTLNTQIDAIMPGDVYDFNTDSFVHLSDVRIDNKEKVEGHILFLANKYEHLFSKINRRRSTKKCEEILEKLLEELSHKLDNFYVSKSYDLCLFFSLLELRSRYICVNLKENTVSIVQKLPYKNVYHLEFPAWQIERVLNRQITWEDFSLTFRAMITRNPDIYDTLITGFLFSQAEDIPSLIKTIEKIRNNKSRIVVEVEGTQYEIDKYCPHQGGDLTYGWAEGACWVCPRHRWKYDLEKGGQCITSKDSIHSVRCLSLETEV